MIIMLAILLYLVNEAETKAAAADQAALPPPRPAVHRIDIDNYKQVFSPSEQMLRRRGNGPDVVWAIYFFKPYCGHCR
jgi:hypothetical protein